MEDLLLSLLMLDNVLIAGSSRIEKCIDLAAAQGWILAALFVIAHEDRSHVYVWVLAAVAAAVKGLLIPWMLRRALVRARIRHEVEPFIPMTASVLLCAAGSALAMAFARSLPMPHGGSPFVVATAVACVGTGFLLMVTRRKAITQVIGYLGLENGVAILGLLVVEDSPLLFEAGVLLDLVVGIFVMGIVMRHIQREFESLDTSRLRELKD